MKLSLVPARHWLGSGCRLSPQGSPQEYVRPSPSSRRLVQRGPVSSPPSPPAPRSPSLSTALTAALGLLRQAFTADSCIPPRLSHPTVLTHLPLEVVNHIVQLALEGHEHSRSRRGSSSFHLDCVNSRTFERG